MYRPRLKSGVFIALLAFLWAAPKDGAAHLTLSGAGASKEEQGTRLVSADTTLPRPARFREARGRGLLVNVWISGNGPFVFALDTGAGSSLIRSDLLQRAQLRSTPSRKIIIGGLTGSGTVSTQQTFLNNVAIGEPGNLLQSGHRALVVPNLPAGLDGILDPTEAYSPQGYVIDLPNRQIESFDIATSKLRLGSEPAGGTVVRWVRDGSSNRPFVRLGDNRLALIDTGSGFGLALTYDAIVSKGNERSQVKSVRDLGGSVVNSRRVAPTTVTIGSLVLEKVPTDVLVGVHENAPVILGRDALYPFRIKFDPASRLIEIAPSR